MSHGAQRDGEFHENDAAPGEKGTPIVTSAERRRAISLSVAAFLVVAAVVLVLFFVPFRRRITGFFRIGDATPVSPFVDPSSAIIYPDTPGYDGQFYLSIALDPLLRHPGTVAALDNPSYRYRRILYPLLAYLLGLGQRRVIPFVMVVINVLCFAALIGIVALYQSPNSGRRNSPLLMLCIPGLWVSATFATIDLLGLVLFLGGVVALRRAKSFLPATLFCLACLAKETFIAAVLCLVVLRSFERNRRQAILLGISVLPPILWIAAVPKLIPMGTSGISENFTVPFRGLLAKLCSLAAGGTGIKNLYEGFCLIVLLVAFLTVIVYGARRRRGAMLQYVWVLPSLALLPVIGMNALSASANYFRVFADIFVVGVMVAAEGPATMLQKGFLVLATLASAGRLLTFFQHALH